VSHCRWNSKRQLPVHQNTDTYNLFDDVVEQYEEEVRTTCVGAPRVDAVQFLLPKDFSATSGDRLVEDFEEIVYSSCQTSPAIYNRCTSQKELDKVNVVIRPTGSSHSTVYDRSTSQTDLDNVNIANLSTDSGQSTVYAYTRGAD